MDSASWRILIIFAMNDVYFSLNLSKKVNERLKRRAAGRHNQTDVYLAIVKRSGNENGTPASQTFVCKNQERRVSFEYLASQASRDIGDGCMRVPDWDNWITDVPVSSQRVRAGVECEEFWSCFAPV